MSVFISILQFTFIIALVISWVIVIIYLRNTNNLPNQSGESKAIQLFLYIIISSAVAIYSVNKLSDWKPKNKPPSTKKSQSVDYKINERTQLFIRQAHAPLADKQLLLQQTVKQIDSTVYELNKLMINHPNNHHFLQTIANHYSQEKQHIVSVLSRIDLHSQNAMLQATTTQNEQIIKQKFYQQSLGLLAESRAAQQHFLKQQAYISSSVSDYLKTARKRLAKQQRYTSPSITATTEVISFSNKNLDILQNYVSIIAPKLAIRVNIIRNELTSAQNNYTTLDALISTGLEDRPQLKKPLAQAQVLWQQAGNDAYQRWVQIISALESAYLASQFGMPTKHPAHHNLLRQIKGASQQYIREIQKANEHAEQSYFTPQD